MTDKQWSFFQPGELRLPSAMDEPVGLLTLDCPEEGPTSGDHWVRHGSDELPLIGVLHLDGLDNFWLLRPWAGHYCWVQGRPVKFVSRWRPSFREHVSKYRHSTLSRGEVVDAATALLSKHQRSNDAQTDSFLRFVRCSERGCGYKIASNLMHVMKGTAVPSGTFHVEPQRGQFIQDFLVESNGHCMHF